MAKSQTKMIIAINEPILSKVIAVRGDANSRFIDVQLYNDGVPVDLNGHTVTMSVKTNPNSPMKNPVDEFISGTIPDPTNGRCMFPLTTSMLAEAGALDAQISVFSGEQEVLSTLTFIIYVEPSLRSDEQIEAENEFGALVVLFSEIQNALEDLHAIATSFGEPSEESIAAGRDTFWKVLEASVKGSADLVAYDIPSKIGEETDAEPYNTLFGKLNRIIKLQLKDGGEIFREDGTFTVPETVNEITIIACGGGGGGALQWKGAPAGGGGAACIKKTSSVSPGQKISITIGKGGEGGKPRDSIGKAGTATVVGSIVTCAGGQGGQESENGGGGAAGGSGGGKGGNAVRNGTGSNGENGLYGTGGKGSKVNQYGIGGGGGSYGNGGNAASTTDQNGGDGGYGAGGGGGKGLSNRGGNGGDGIVIIRWGAGSD